MFCNEKSHSTFSKSKSSLKRQSDASKLGTAKKKIRECDKIQKSQLLKKMTLQARNRKYNRYNRFCGKPLSNKSELDKFFMDSEDEISEITSKVKSSPKESCSNISVSPTSARKYTNDLLKPHNSFKPSKAVTPLNTLENSARLCTIGYTKCSRLEDHINNFCNSENDFGTSSSNGHNNCSDNDGLRLRNGNKSSYTFKEQSNTRSDETFKCFTAQHLCNFSLLKFKNNTEANNIVHNILLEANQFIQCNGLNENNKLENELLSPKFKCFMNPTTKNNIKTNKMSIPYHDLAIEHQNDVDSIHTVENGTTIVNEGVPLNKIIENICIEICEKSTSDDCSCALEFSEELSHKNVNTDNIFRENMKKNIPKKTAITPNNYLCSGISIDTISCPLLIFRKESPTNRTLNECVLIPNNKTAVVNKDSTSNINTGTFCAKISEILHCFKTQKYLCSHNLSKMKINDQANNRVCKLLTKAKTSILFNIPDVENAFINELLTSELKYFMVPTTKNKINSRNSVSLHDIPDENSDKGFNFIENSGNFVKSRAFNKDVNKKSHKFDDSKHDSKIENINKDRTCNKDITGDIFGNIICSSNVVPDSNEMLNTTSNVSESMIVNISLPANNYNTTGIKIMEEAKYYNTNTEDPDSISELRNVDQKSSIILDNKINIFTKADEGAVSIIIDNDLDLPVIPIENKCYQIINGSSATLNNLYYYNTKQPSKDAIINKDVSPSINIKIDDFRNDEIFQCQKDQIYSCINNIASSKSNTNVNIIVNKLLSLAKTFMFCNDINKGNTFINELNSSKWKCTVKPRPMGEFTDNVYPIENNITAINKCWAFGKDLNEFDLEVCKKTMRLDYFSGDDVEVNKDIEIFRSIVTDDNVPDNIQKLTDHEILTNNFISNNNNNILTRDEVREIGPKISEKAATLNSCFCDDDEMMAKITDKIYVDEGKLYKKYKAIKKRTTKSFTPSVATKRKMNSTDKNKIDFIDIDSIVLENRSLINIIKNTRSHLDAVDSPVIGRKQFITTDKRKNQIINVDNIIYENKTLIDIYNKQKSLGTI